MMNDYPDSITYADDVEKEKVKGKKLAVVVGVAVLVAFLLTLWAVFHGDEGNSMSDTVASAIAPISGVSDSALQSEVNKLRAEKLELQQQVASLKTDKRNADALASKLTSEAEVLKKERDTAIASQATVQEQYNKLSEVHDSGPQWEKRFMKANGWHLSFGGVASNPITFNASEIEFKPTITLLAGAGPRRWQVLAGVGYGIEQGMTLSLGFMWTFGDIGLWEVK